ncbi:cysteine desulfurase family protein [Rhodocista pekingensis]|uniref:Cysteine desulfurase n=1 Tax=Rhodocista pekingensis TaxID=201185 RepID=A0ABW2KZ48_9PROT
MMAAGVYLDWNATAPLRPEARAAMLAALEEVGNPSSVHGFGRRARRRVEEGRLCVAALVGASPEQVVFTGGGTEANALALRTPAACRLVSAVEHVSVLDAAPDAGRIPVNADGRVDPAALAVLLEAAPGPVLVSVQAANNETGVIQPVAEIATLVRARGGFLHVDAAQAAGRLPLDLRTLGAHLLTLSAHKLGGPQGVGALVVADGVPLEPLLRGGGQERRRRAGTENVAGIAGFGAAAQAAGQDLGFYDTLARRRDALETRLLASVPQARSFGSGVPRLGNTLCLALPGVPAETQLMALDLAGIAVSSGAACSSGKVHASHVLRAMGVADDLAAGAIRVSAGWLTTEAELDRFAEAWLLLARQRQPVLARTV